MKKATIKKAKELSRLGGWANFKQRLMVHLDIPLSDYDTWDVPKDWLDAHMKAHGRDPKNPFKVRRGAL